MVIKLRRILNEKLEKWPSMVKNAKQLEVKKKENEDVLNKAVRMFTFSGFNVMIGDFYHFLYSVSISILLFFYVKYDKVLQRFFWQKFADMRFEIFCHKT